MHSYTRTQTSCSTGMRERAQVAGSTYRSQRDCPGWFPAHTVAGDIHPSQPSDPRVTHEKNESRFRLSCAHESKLVVCFHSTKQ